MNDQLYSQGHQHIKLSAAKWASKGNLVFTAHHTVTQAQLTETSATITSLMRKAYPKTFTTNRTEAWANVEWSKIFINGIQKKNWCCAPTCGPASVTLSWLGSATARLLVAACVGILVKDGIGSMESVRLGYRAISWRMVFLFTLQRPSSPRPMAPAHFTHPRVQCSIMRRGRSSSVNDIQVDTATTIATEGEGGRCSSLLNNGGLHDGYVSKGLPLLLLFFLSC